MKVAISVKRRGTRIASSARSTWGKLVVAPSSAALRVPIVALTDTVARMSRPSRETPMGPIS